jgi:hypothetical protein
MSRKLLKTKRRKEIIVNELSNLTRKKIRFQDITSLAKHLQDTINGDEGASLNPNGRRFSYTSLLRRKSSYRPLLLEYWFGTSNQTLNSMSEGINEHSMEVSTAINTTPALQAFVLKLELKIKELNRDLSLLISENRRLKVFLDANNFNAGSKINCNSDSSHILNNFEKMATAFKLIVESIDFLAIDYEHEQIIDRSNFDRPILDRELLKPFFQAIRGVPKLPE